MIREQRLSLDGYSLLERCMGPQYITEIWEAEDGRVEVILEDTRIVPARRRLRRFLEAPYRVSAKAATL